MPKIKVDPLGDVSLFWLSKQDRKRCNCPAKDDFRMKHSFFCGVSPIYAEMVKEYFDPEARNTSIEIIDNTPLGKVKRRILI